MATHSQSDSTLSSPFMGYSESNPFPAQFLPRPGKKLCGQIFQGILSYPDGSVRALVALRNGKAFEDKTSWTNAMELAAAEGGMLPSPLEAAYIRALGLLTWRPCWHWTDKEVSVRDAVGIHMLDGSMLAEPKSEGGRVLVIQRIPIALHIPTQQRSKQ